MKENNFQNKVFNAAKWSSITEIAAKLITPLTNMILARILVPEAFGVAATVTMIISFADMFTDSGFQKYLVQRNFKSEEEKLKNANVAFWTNFGISIFLWLLIFVFRDKIATFVGNPGLGNVLAIASLQLIMTSFSSVQMALYRREFDFKTLFFSSNGGSIYTFRCYHTSSSPWFELLGINYWFPFLCSFQMQLY